MYRQRFSYTVLYNALWVYSLFFCERRVPWSLGWAPQNKIFTVFIFKNRKFWYTVFNSWAQIEFNCFYFWMTTEANLFSNFGNKWGSIVLISGTNEAYLFIILGKIRLNCSYLRGRNETQLFFYLGNEWGWIVLIFWGINEAQCFILGNNWNSILLSFGVQIRLI